MKVATIIFLIKRDESSKIKEVLMAMKKRGFGVNKWNGTGGKVGPDETIEDAAVREASEELLVSINTKDLKKVAEMHFTFDHEDTWETMAHTFLTETWEGEPTETEEMRPQWFPVAEIPYHAMWPGDDIWLSQVFKDKVVKGEFNLKDEGNLKTAVLSFVEKL